MLRFFIVCLSGVALIGCGGGPSDMPELGQVSGVVTVGDKPLAGAIVKFSPQENGRPSSAVTAEDGSFSLQYTAENEGAVVGTHTVTVSVPQAEGNYESDDKQDKASGLPAAASDRSLTMKVEAGANTFDIKL